VFVQLQSARTALVSAAAALLFAAVAVSAAVPVLPIA